MAHPRLTEEQVTIFQEVFSLYDIDHDGTIKTKHLNKVMQCLGCDFTKDEIFNLKTEIDPVGSEVINFQQFLVMMSHHLKKEPALEEQRREVFKFFDVDNKGYISVSDLRQAMTNLGEQLTKDDIRQMIEEVGIQEDRHVNYDDFIRIVTPNY